MPKFKRVMGLAAVTAIAGAFPVLAATPAQANVNDCSAFVRHNGYVVGPKVRAACSEPALHLPGGAIQQNPHCLAGLVGIGVDMSTANWACGAA
ncbi:MULTISPECIES: hypothetical protein [Streptomyces]|uniref:hypothetical protein n=1 Tax=Streptomyces TaxID=1883 RepID=UPI00131BB422|nr:MULTISPECIES: hypothetical protein [Streptomyces]